MLLPALLTDLLFPEKAPDARVTLLERNPAMGEVLQGYGDAVFRRAGLSGSFLVTSSREEALRGADAVIYAGDCEPATRFEMDRQALSGENDDDPGLSDQARVNGGLGGLLHALRAGNEILNLCDDLDRLCPEALVVNLGQPLARTTAVFLNRGYRCFGLGRTPWRGANGLDTLAKRMKTDPAQVQAVIAGLPGFAFLLSLSENGRDLLPRLKRAAKNGELGSLSKRWLDWWDALPVGDVTDHAEFLPAQPDFQPDSRPDFGESVERRRERILWMNTVREKGAGAGEGGMAQLLLLSKVPPIRPMRLCRLLLWRQSGEVPAVTRQNNGELEGLPAEAVIESALTLKDGQMQPHHLALPAALREMLRSVDEVNRLAARAAAGDRAALREAVEIDPALAGLDRLYCQDVVEAMIDLHRDVLPRL